jgi:hypothetical protein
MTALFPQPGGFEGFGEGEEEAQLSDLLLAKLTGARRPGAAVEAAHELADRDRPCLAAPCNCSRPAYFRYERGMLALLADYRRCREDPVRRGRAVGADLAVADRRR